MTYRCLLVGNKMMKDTVAGEFMGKKSRQRAGNL